jgi:hypothetical protein
VAGVHAAAVAHAATTNERHATDRTMGRFYIESTPVRTK